MTRPIKSLGEVALRVSDLDAMQRFYQEVVGLELLRRFENAAFFKLAEGYGGTRMSWPCSTARGSPATPD
jgi:catechol 2,3-dioxygenase-like lactoylglutathione lyase family enzyme